MVDAQEVDRGDAGLLEQRLGLLDVVAVDGLRPPVGGVALRPRRRVSIT